MAEVGNGVTWCGSAEVEDKDAELARLRKRVAELETEKEILRKAAAYFALVRE
ncbi:hypothetical protein [Saccharopolyspora sp. NPDC050642]|uniref:hypothetical protein n=1 Tax=Saccharopolyspora sp. NPDC050642 TaxID=3157099 RepID=UPI0033E61336